MKLTAKESYALLTKYGCYVTEVCDKCHRLLGPVRFSRHGRGGQWCSRECRDGGKAHAPGTCLRCGRSLHGLRRGTRFCSDTCRKRENRRSRTTQISRDAPLKTMGLQSAVNPTHHDAQKDILGSANECLDAPSSPILHDSGGNGTAEIKMDKPKQPSLF